MKFKPPLAPASLIRRYKRFLADVELPDGGRMTIHCPNTGSMKNCGAPGSPVWYSTSDNKTRKYPHTFELVQIEDGSIAGINTGRANALVEEALAAGVVPELQGYGTVRREVRYGEEKSRIDFFLSDHAAAPNCYVEVKNVTLAMGEGLGLFPDAVTARGTKHLRELMRIRQAGHRAVLFFCVQHSGIDRVAAARDIDPAYAATLAEARAAGVEVLAYAADISPGEIRLVRPVLVIDPP